MSTKILTIMFTDIKGFTARTSESSREGMQQLLAEHERLLKPVFESFGGRVVKTIGDAFLVWFESPTDGVLCGLAIQEVLRQRNAGVPQAEAILVRVAINLGEVEFADGDVLGEAVNIASRLEGVAEAGEVWFTEAAYLSMNRKEVSAVDAGERTFKGIPYPVRVYKTSLDVPSESARRIREAVKVTKSGVVIAGFKRAGAPIHRRPAVIAAGLAALLAAGAAGIFGVHAYMERLAIMHAEEFVVQGQPLSALDLLDQAIRHDPINVDLRGRAVAIARGHLKKLLADGRKDEAAAWLSRQLKERSYLEPLQGELAAIEAEAAGRSPAAGRGSSH
ncbi:MAG: hypothetical protein HY078_14445 [Elusimicrobia bacterium]|nr:hypothetical protein [Elusimicrobiota bacterium]